jgi:hypothetical protein
MSLMAKNTVAALVWTAILVPQFCPLSAARPSRRDPPRLSVRVYGFPGLSPALLVAAEDDTSRVLRTLPLQLNWLNCPSAPGCFEPEAPEDFSIRVMEKALPDAPRSVVGMAAWYGTRGTALIFYDRALALRTKSHMLRHILGRVMAHELMHLLMPEASHSNVGLMRARWTADNLALSSSESLGISESAIRQLEESHHGAGGGGSAVNK